MITQVLPYEPSQDVLCTTPEASTAISEKTTPVNRTAIDPAIPVAAPPVLLARRPLSRFIEGSRPVLVLGEGIRLITIHPLARTIFWGGLGNWVCSSILTAHHADATMRFLVLVAQVCAWLLLYFSRGGRSATHRGGGRLGEARGPRPHDRSRVYQSSSDAQGKECH